MYTVPRLQYESMHFSRGMSGQLDSDAMKYLPDQALAAHTPGPDPGTTAINGLSFATNRYRAWIR